jgi:hypothetical protein
MAKYKVKDEASGQTFTIEGPDDATEEELQQAAAQYVPTTEPEATPEPPPPEPTFESWRASKHIGFPQVARALAKGGARGMAKGGLGIANMIQNATGGDIMTGQPVPLAEINAGIDKVIPPESPEGLPLVEGLGELGGEMVPNVMGTNAIMGAINPGILTKARELAGVIPSATKALSTLEAPVENYPRLARALASIRSGATAGAVSGAITPTDDPTTFALNTTLGGALGGAVPAVTGTIGGTVNYIKGLVKKPDIERKVATNILERIGPVAAEETANMTAPGRYVDPGTHGLDRTMLLDPTYPVGTRKTTAAVTENPGLAVDEGIARSVDPARFSLYDKFNDDVSRKYLDVLTPNEVDLLYAKSLRDQVTDPLRDALTIYPTEPADALEPFFKRVGTSAMVPGTPSQRMLSEGTNALAPADGGMTAALIKTNRQMADAIGANGATSGLFSSVRDDPAFGNQLLSEMNATLDKSTANKWSQYLATHKELSKLPNEYEAQQKVKELVDKDLLTQPYMKSKMLVRALAKEAENPYGSQLTPAWTPRDSDLGTLGDPLTAGSRPYYDTLIDDLKKREFYTTLERQGNLGDIQADQRIAQGAEGPLLSNTSRLQAILRPAQNLALSGIHKAVVNLQLDPNLYSTRMKEALQGRLPPTLKQLQERAQSTAAANTALQKVYDYATQ